MENLNYPYNAIWTIIEEHFRGNVPEEFKEMSSTQAIGLKEALSFFDERTQKIFFLRWRDRRSLKEIGEEVGLSVERTRQILFKTLLILSFQHFDLILYGEKEIERRRKEKEEKEEIDKLPTIILSARSYHALFRAGISTVGELLKMTESNLRAVRSLGQKSMDEVLFKISEFRKEYGEDIEKFSIAPLKKEEK